MKPKLIAQVAKEVTDRFGLFFPAERSADLVRGLRAASLDSGFPDAGSYGEWLVSGAADAAHWQRFAAHLTIGETYFLRDPRLFAVIADEVLPALLQERERRRRPLRIWSAGCCSGEEPYTLAIWLRRAAPGLSSAEASIMGTDINPDFLHKASEGVYGDWSFRATPPEFRETYFAKEGPGRWRIDPAVRAMVTFSALNLVDFPNAPSSPVGTFDLIVCRNVLIYFSAKQAAHVVDQLARALAPGGWLVLGANEMPVRVPAMLTRMQVDGLTLWRRDVLATSATADVRPLPDMTAAVPWVAPESVFDAGPMNVVESPRRAETSAPPPPMTGDDLWLTTRRLADQGRVAEALTCCNRLIATHKMDPNAYYLRANLLLESGEPNEAKTALSRALYLNPEFVLAHFALGNLSRGSGDDAAAQRSFGNVLRLIATQDEETPLPGGEGITAGRLREIVQRLCRPQALA